MAFSGEFYRISYSYWQERSMINSLMLDIKKNVKMRACESEKTALLEVPVDQTLVLIGANRN